MGESKSRGSTGLRVSIEYNGFNQEKDAESGQKRQVPLLDSRNGRRKSTQQIALPMVWKIKLRQFRKRFNKRNRHLMSLLRTCLTKLSSLRRWRKKLATLRDRLEIWRED